MALEKTINLSPNSSENTSFENNGVVSARDFKVLRKKVDGTTASLSVALGEIDLRVTYEDIINAINISTEGIIIQANRIDISGLVTFSDLSTAGQTTINGSNITTGTLNASLVNVTNINASNITAGSLTVDRLTVGTVSGWYFGTSSISRSGIVLGANYISLTGNSTADATLNFITNGGTVRLYGNTVGSIACSGRFDVDGALVVDGAITSNTGMYSPYLSISGDSVFRLIRPTTDNLYDVGTASYRWDDIYATNNVIQTSDMSDKENIKEIDKAVDFILGLRPVQFKWKSGNRNHYGFLAQDIKKNLDKNGIDSGIYVDPAMSGEEGMKGLRYSEFIAPLVQTIQQMNERLMALENA